MPLSSIGRSFGRASSLIFPHLTRTGGIRPSSRVRSRIALTSREREEISCGLAADLSLRAIARDLVRAPSTISREVDRNGRRKTYRAACCDQRAWDCAQAAPEMVSSADRRLAEAPAA
nr:helix-turn-helix domain-containing protein [Paracoccus gahaiensis]